MKLRETLQAMTVNDLKEIAALLPGNIQESRKAQWVDSIADVLESDWLKELIDGFDGLQRLAVSYMVHGGWKALNSERFFAIHGEVPFLGELHQDMWGFTSWKTKSGMWLLFYNGVIPSDLHPRLRLLVDPIPLPSLHSSKTWRDQFTLTLFDFKGGESIRHEPVTTYLSESIALHEVTQALSLAQQGKLRWTNKTLLPTKATLQKMKAQLAAPDFLEDSKEWGDLSWRNLSPEDVEAGSLRAFAWPTLLLSAKWVSLTGSKHVLTTKGKSALSKSAPEILKLLWLSWIKKHSFDELSRIPSIKGQKTKGKKFLTPPESRRTVIADVLKRCPPGEWVGVLDIMRYMRSTNQTPDVLRNEDQALHLYIGDKRYGNLLDTGQLWEILEGRYIRCFLMEYAATLGVVDLAYGPPDIPQDTFPELHYNEDPYLSPYDGLQAIRLTPLGAWILGSEDIYIPPIPKTQGLLKVLPNCDVVLLENVTPEPMTRLLLDAYMDNSGPFVWFLHRDKLLNAISSGQDLQRLRSFLGANTEEPLPPSVSSLLDDVQRRANLITEEGRAILLHVADPIIAIEIAHHPKMRALCRLAGDDHLIVKESDETAFRRALHKFGYITKT